MVLPREESIRSTKSLKSVRSIRSSRSMRSIKSTLASVSELVLPTFEELLPLACEKTSCPFSVFVKRQYQQDDFYKQLKVKEAPVKYKKITLNVPVAPVSLLTIQNDEKTTRTSTSLTTIDEDTIAITSIYDNVHNLTEINMTKVRGVVPRGLIQLLGYMAPSYEYLAKITINRCKIDSTIIYELGKILSTSFVTDICLDGSPVREGCYYSLLECRNSRIKNLSLCGCNINDKVCKEIASRLHFMCPAENTLLLLNLSSNHIADEGAKYLGEALRTNRHLRYLNLADNRIGDKGASHIFNALMEFRLKYDENRKRRNRRIEYLRDKNEMILKYLNECGLKLCDEFSQATRKLDKRKKMSATSLKQNGPNKKDQRKEKIPADEDYKAMAESFATGIVGPFIDPFHPNSITMKHDSCFSPGNMTLCYLNLSYNQLEYLTVKKLLSVLQYQQKIASKQQNGLLKVVIEGNPIPSTCIEYQNINELFRFGKSLQQFGRRQSDASVKKRRPTRMSIVVPPTTGQ